MLGGKGRSRVQSPDLISLSCLSEGMGSVGNKTKLVITKPSLEPAGVKPAYHARRLGWCVDKEKNPFFILYFVLPITKDSC